MESVNKAVKYNLINPIFIGNETEINIKTNKPEFLDWRWIETSKLPEIAVQFKAEMYKLITKELISLKLT